MAVPMTVATEGAAGNLVPSDFEREVINLTVGDARVAGRIPANRKYFLERVNDSIPVTYSGMDPDWVDELDSKHQDYMEFKDVTLHGKELTLLTAMTDMLLTNSVVAMESEAAREAMKGFAKKVDAAILGLAGATPSNWTYDDGGWVANFENAVTITGQVKDGGSYTDIALFFSAMLAELEANENFDEQSAVWFIAPSAKQYVRDGRTSNGQPLFLPDINSQDGTLGTIYGIPVVWVLASTMPATRDVFLVDMSKVVFGVKADNIGFDKSNVAAYTKDGALRSAFEKNETVYKWFSMYAFNIVDPQAIVAGIDIEEAIPAP